RRVRKPETTVDHRSRCGARRPPGREDPVPDRGDRPSRVARALAYPALASVEPRLAQSVRAAGCGACRSRGCPEPRTWNTATLLVQAARSGIELVLGRSFETYAAGEGTRGVRRVPRDRPAFFEGG